MDPTENLKAGTTYTATVKGGLSGVRDVTGHAMTADTTWSFTTTLRSVAPAEVPADVIRDTIPNRTLPDTGGAQGVRNVHSTTGKTPKTDAMAARMTARATTTEMESFGASVVCRS